MNLNAVKRDAARAFDVLGINGLGHLLQRMALSPFIRVLNYHEIPAKFAENFEEHLKFYSSRFVNATRPELEEFLDSGKWPHDKPGLIISFDDGTRSHYEVAAPLLEKYGFTGWFFVPSGWVLEENAAKPEFIGDNITLTPEQLRYLDENHVVGCHSETHCRLSEDLGPEKLKFETLEAKTSLEKLLGHPVDIFCWVGGEEYTYSKTAADFIKQGYDLSFMTNTAVVRPGLIPCRSNEAISKRKIPFPSSDSSSRV